MRTTVDAAQAARQAGADAGKAAERAGVELALLGGPSEIRAASALFSTVWGTANTDAHIPPDLLRALTHAGNYAAGAYAGDELVGAVVGFLGRDGDGPYLHSHILGVAGAARGANIGFALKLHQRAWALDAGLRKITWTFDPLVRRNAYFNLNKLGAHADAYHERFYGSMTDGINAGDESDRLLVVWQLDADSVTRAAGDDRHEPNLDSLRASGATSALCATSGGDPETAKVVGDVVLCATPEDAIAIRRGDPDLALRWRRALRDTLGGALSDGYSVSGFTRSGWYVLERDARA
jgi:predicted GNAT superfamily acetyltransferase